MKKLILVLASIAVVIAAGLATLAVVYRYENIKASQKLQNQREAAEQNKKIAEAKWGLEDQITSLKTDYNTLHTECLKGNASYDLLTVANQRKVERPTCGSAK